MVCRLIETGAQKIDMILACFPSSENKNHKQDIHLKKNTRPHILLSKQENVTPLNWRAKVDVDIQDFSVNGFRIGAQAWARQFIVLRPIIVGRQTTFIDLEAE